MQNWNQNPSQQHLKYLNNRTAIIIVFIIAFIGYIIFLTDNLYPGGDNARYLIFAKSLASGKGYRNIGLVSEPIHGLAPPGFALILTLIVKSFGINIILVKNLIAFFGALSILFVYIFMNQRATSNRALLVSILYALTPVIFMYSRRVYSDLLFMIFVLLVLISIQQYTKTNSKINRWLFLSAVCLIFSFYIRPVGLVLLLTSGIWLVFIRRAILKALFLIVPVILAIFPWYYWVSQEVKNTSTGHFSAFISLNNIKEVGLLLIHNFYQYLNLISENIWYLPTKGITHLGLSSEIFSLLIPLSTFIVSFIILVGFFYTIWANFDISDLFVVIYMLTLLPYTFVIDRFIIPIVPFIIFYYIQGIFFGSETLAQRITKFPKLPSYLSSLFIIAIIFSSVVHIGARIYQEQNFDKFHSTQAGLYELASWAKENTESSAIILTDEPDFFYIYGERQTIDGNQENPNMTIEDFKYFTEGRGSFTKIEQWLPSDVSVTAIKCSQKSNLCLYEVNATTP